MDTCADGSYGEAQFGAGAMVALSADRETVVWRNDTCCCHPLVWGATRCYALLDPCCHVPFRPIYWAACWCGNALALLRTLRDCGSANFPVLRMLSVGEIPDLRCVEVMCLRRNRTRGRVKDRRQQQPREMCTSHGVFLTPSRWLSTGWD
jgi:hypothetical protein